jgi:molybdopterin-guanine dinucleotide biosynthesis protein A
MAAISNTMAGVIPAPIGVVLAGGAGRRLGGAKATVMLAGRPLISYPLAALSAAIDDLAIVAKADSPLPDDLGGAQVWTEPDEPRHPIVGLVTALQRAEGRAIVVVAADLPLLDAGTTLALATARPAPGAVAVVARSDGRPQPLIARYEPDALEHLAAADPSAALTTIVEATGPTWLDLPDADVAFNVNDPDDLAEAERRLAQRRARGS